MKKKTKKLSPKARKKELAGINIALLPQHEEFFRFGPAVGQFLNISKDPLRIHIKIDKLRTKKGRNK